MATIKKSSVDEETVSGPSPADVSETGTEAQDGPDELKKNVLIDLVVARSGIKKKDAKPVVEATLAVLGQALSEGRALNLQPLGKLKVTRTKDLDNGQMMVARVRRSTQSIAETEGLETTAEEG